MIEHDDSIHNAEDIPEDDVRFQEEDMPLVLSERDALSFLEALENPPKPNAAALKAAKRFKEQYG
jgi:uncharacterized protein (DUF1778 family)